MRTALLLALSLAMAEESTLRRAAAETRRPRQESAPPAQPPAQPQPPAARPQRAERTHLQTDADDDSGSGLWLIDGIVDLFRLPDLTWQAVGSGDNHPRGSYAVLRRPFAGDEPGALAWRPPLALPAEDQPPARMPARLPTADWAVRLGGGAALIDDDVWRGGGEARLHAPFRFALDLQADWYRESLPDGDVDLGLVDADVTWRLVQFRNASLAVGGGGRWLRDGIGTESGAAFTLDAEVQPLRPVVVGASLGTGRIGTASLFEWRVEAGAVLDRYEAVIGWERTDIGRVALDGPYLALRCWL